MRIVSCLVTEHDPWFVLLASAICFFGSDATLRLWRRALADGGRNRFDWLFLTGLTAGASIWSTHFIAMLGFQPETPVSFHAPLTVASIIIAILGATCGLFLTGLSKGAGLTTLGGAVIGLSIATMHFTGMFAYRTQGVVSWDLGYILLAIALAIGFSVLVAHMTTRCVRAPSRRRAHGGTAALVAAIVSLHFTGMAAFSVTPVPGQGAGVDGEAFLAMAMAVAMVALLIVFAGLSSQTIEKRVEVKSQAEMRHRAVRDELTGLANRRGFHEGLERLFDEASRSGLPFALIMIDLDRFKTINDVFGPRVGDRVIKTVAERMASLAPVEGIAARISGNTFAVLAPLIEAADEEAALALCSRVLEALSQSFAVDGQILEIDANLGVAIAPGHGADPDSLLQHAGIALNAAKEDEGAACRLFEAAMAERIRERRVIEDELRRAVRRGEFEVYYQPQIDARSGANTGAEALVRWRHPERGLLSPALFIPQAETLGLIEAIGRQVLARACADAASWPAPLTVAVNLSPVQILDRRLLPTLRSALARTGLDPARLELEITESALIGNDVQALAVLGEIRRLGVAVALDDFGTGYSSLSYLHRFPIDRIKIDRSFIDRVPEDGDSVSIVRAIMGLGANLKLKVTAEGIETEAQRRFACAEGCDQLQGYLIGKPMPQEAYLAFLAHRAAQAAVA